MFGSHVTVTLTGPSDAVPDAGDTLHQDSDEETLQSLFAVNVMVCEPPSFPMVILVEPVNSSIGAFSQEMTLTMAKRAQMTNPNSLFMMGLAIVQYTKVAKNLHSEYEQ